MRLRDLLDRIERGYYRLACGLGLHEPAWLLRREGGAYRAISVCCRCGHGAPRQPAVTTYHRALAVHMHFAKARSALED